MTTTLWITYTGEDEPGDIHSLSRELAQDGVRAFFDELHGDDLWAKLSAPIQDPSLDAFGMVLTPSSVESPRTREEVAYALHQIRQARGGDFPIITLLQAVPFERVPPALRGTGVVSLAHPDWRKQVVSWVGGVRPEVVNDAASRYRVALHREIGGVPSLSAIELAPRGGAMEHWRFGLPMGYTGLSAWGRAKPGGIAAREAITYQDRDDVVSGIRRTFDEVRYEFSGAGNPLDQNTSLYLLFRGVLPKSVAFAGAMWPDGEPVIEIEHWKTAALGQK
ncbi:MAG: toll/interleukin-1 receptor domain-containing protein [Deltaproteobacteria bacterium]|nr:toll/interleukin-1 receptor domain-containing protein [Deltaproteobacteria bacterium]